MSDRIDSKMAELAAALDAQFEGRLAASLLERPLLAPTQLDRIEAMLVRLTHHINIGAGYSGEYHVSCSCGWRGKGWRFSGPGSGVNRIGPEVEFEGHLADQLPPSVPPAALKGRR